MLPFMPDKKTGSVSQASVKDGEIKDDEAMDPGLEEAAQAMLRAINMKDAKALASAIKEAYEICESYEDDDGAGVSE